MVAAEVKKFAFLKVTLFLLIVVSNTGNLLGLC